MLRNTHGTTAQHLSPWMADIHMPVYFPLRHDVRADVCVVGAGIAGLSVAYRLMREGQSVVVLDDGPVAGGTTQVTTAHLTCAIDDRLYEIERMHGQVGCKLAAQSHAAAIDEIQSVITEEGIDCEFERLDGFLFSADPNDHRELDWELEAAHRAGLGDVEWMSNAPGLNDLGPCLRFPHQGQFHPLKYLAGLAKAIERNDGQIYCDTHADSIDRGKPAAVRTGSHVVQCDAVVVATNTPINDWVTIHTKQSAYMTYAIGATIPRDAVNAALYWDTGDPKASRPRPYHYIRIQRSLDGRDPHDLLIVGGEDHKTGQANDTPDRYMRLEQWARQRFPMIKEVKFTWAGQVMEPVDGVAFIGRNPGNKDNVFIATGDSGMGMTHGVIAGILLSDLIIGRWNPWTELYDPSRITISALGRYARENVNMASQYVDWVTPGDIKSADDLELDSGAVMRDGMNKLAIYRDPSGKLHYCSAVCPHLGGIVQWNASEKTWDCPCHGSRFDRFGQAICGPANVPLAPKDRGRKGNEPHFEGFGRVV